MIKSFLKLNQELLSNWNLIISLGKKEFKNEYAGSALGIVWGMLKPFTMVLAYWFVFAIGMRSADVGDVPYVAWLIPGLFAWNFLSESLLSGTSAIRDNAHLVKKVVFPISILPIVKIFTKLINHLIFMTIALILVVLMGQVLTIYAIQLVYYLFAGILFTIAITRLFSAMAVMSVDFVHFISTIMQLLFWATPVIYSATSVAEKYPALLIVLKLNPYYYLVQGYRDALFSNTWFWTDPAYTLYFWGLTLAVFLIGSYYYDKNRKEFADVL